MKKATIILIILVGIISCTENHNPSGVWISIKDKQMTSKNGYTAGLGSLVLDFDNLQASRLSMSKDSIVEFRVKSETKTITQENDGTEFKYSLYNKDSLEFYVPYQNKTRVFIPLNLEHELDYTKNDIINQFISKEFKRLNDTLKIEFSNSFFKDEYFTNGIENKRILKTKFLEFKEFTGYWYIGEKNQNYFLVYNLDPYGMKEYIYQITDIQKGKIKLKGILTENFGDRITELKTSL